MPDGWIRAATAARMAGVSRERIRQLTQELRIRACVVGVRKCYVHPGDLKAWIHERKVRDGTTTA